MLPKSKWLRVLLITVPLILVALLWKPARQRPRFVATPARAETLALSYDGSRLAMATKHPQVWWREAGDFHRLPMEIAAPGANISQAPTLQFARDGRTLTSTNLFLAADYSRAAYRWNLADDKIAWSAVSPHKNDGNEAELSSDGRRIAQHSYDVFLVRNLTNEGTPQTNAKSKYARDFPLLLRLRLKLPNEDGLYLMPADFTLSHDAATLILAEKDGRLRFWNIASKQRTAITPPLPARVGEIGNLVASPDGRFVALCDSVSVALWDNKTNAWTKSAQTSPATHYLAWMSDSRPLWLGNDISTGEEKNLTRQLSAPALKTMRTLPVWGPLAVAGDGHTLVTRAERYSPEGVWLWNID